MLTPRQARFVEEYLVDLSATQAAIRAGYSRNTAGRIGSENLRKSEISAAIDIAMSARSDRTEVTADRVLSEISVMAFYDPGDLIDVRGPADIKRLPEGIRRAIVGWGWDRNQNFTLKLADKSKALDQLARHLSLYNDKLEVTGLQGLADHLAYAERGAAA
jgi:phage terminase small subunit